MLKNVFAELKYRKDIEDRTKEMDKRNLINTIRKLDEVERYLRYNLVPGSEDLSTFNDEDRDSIISIADELVRLEDLVYKHFKNKYGEKEADKFLFVYF